MEKPPEEGRRFRHKQKGFDEAMVHDNTSTHVDATGESATAGDDSAAANPSGGTADSATSSNGTGLPWDTSGGTATAGVGPHFVTPPPPAPKNGTSKGNSPQAKEPKRDPQLVRSEQAVSTESAAPSWAQGQPFLPTDALRPCQTTAQGEAHVATVLGLEYRSDEWWSEAATSYDPVIPAIPASPEGLVIPENAMEYAEALDPAREDKFFGRTELLGAIRASARLYTNSPWSAFLSTAMQTVCRIGPQVRIPTSVGGKDGTLDMSGIHLAPSGGGKGTPPPLEFRIGGCGAPIGAPEKENPGTGPAVPACYVRRENVNIGTEIEPIYHPKMFVHTVAVTHIYDEVKEFADSKNGQHSLGSEFLKMWSGQRLGKKLKGDDQRTYEYQVRGCLEISTQPANAAAVTDDIDTGDAQRLVYAASVGLGLPLTDEEIAAARAPLGDLSLATNDKSREAFTHEEGEVAKHAAILIYLHPMFGSVRYNRAGYVFGTLENVRYVELSKKVRAIIVARKYADKADRNFNKLDSHLTLAWLKIAVALAAMHGEFMVTEFWWDLAGVFMEHSLLVREIAMDGAANARRNEQVKKGKDDAQREVAKVEKREELTDEAFTALCDGAANIAAEWDADGEHPDGWTRSQMKRKLRIVGEERIAAVIAALVDGQVIHDTGRTRKSATAMFPLFAFGPKAA